MASMWSKKASKAGGGKRFGLVKKQGSNSVPAIFGGGADDDAPADARGAMNRRLQAMEASSRKKAAAAAADVDPSIYEDLKRVLGNVERNSVLRALVRYSIKKDEDKPSVEVGKKSP